MSIDGINGTTTPLSLASTSAAAGGLSAARSAARAGIETAAVATAAAAGATAADSNAKPAPLRFPWLSRLSSELGAASKTPVTFSAPVLGDNVDKQA